MQGRARVKEFLHKCTLCRKYGAKLLEKPPAASLPDFRAKCCDPFSYTGLDYIGPIYVYPSPSSKEAVLEKVHIVLYTCANSRAIYLDIVTDLSALAFVNSLKRFISRRGIPKLFISDNAKCFISAETKRFVANRLVQSVKKLSAKF